MNATTTEASARPTCMTKADSTVAQRLWRCWSGLWSGLEIADPAEFLADDITVHLPRMGMPDPRSLTTRDSVVTWIRGFVSCYDADTSFVATHGPWLVEQNLVIRWRFTGTWMRAVPATATALPGSAVAIEGVDILRVEAGRIREYWLSDDQLDLYAQLGAAVPAWVGEVDG